MPPAFRTLNQDDVKISELVGLETYKALYTLWPDLYSYISDPLVPTNYFVSLVSSIVAGSGFSYEQGGTVIHDTLLSIVLNEPVSDENQKLVDPLLGSSYTIKNLNYTFWENVVWISITVFLSFWIIWYLYAVGFWSSLFNNVNGMTCYDCKSMFDYIEM